MDINIAHFVMLLVGVALGAVGSLLISRQTRSEPHIEKQLRDLQEEFTAYRENVNQHFNQTTRLVNKLTNDYAKVQQHLGEAADSFAQPPKSFELDADSKGALAEREELLQLEIRNTELGEGGEDAQFDNPESLEQPKDYAPKAKSQKGTLAEDFGLNQ